MSDTDARRRLRTLAKAVLALHACAKSSGPCQIITMDLHDTHPDDVWRLAREANDFLNQLSEKPS